MNLVKQLKSKSKYLTILYAEDEETIRTSTCKSLERFFAKTLVAKDGKEALELFNTNVVDLILTDINMPHMTGIDFIKEIKANNEVTPPIILITAYNKQSQLPDIINLNIDCFMQKPIEKENFIEILYKVCSNINIKNEVR